MSKKISLHSVPSGAIMEIEDESATTNFDGSLLIVNLDVEQLDALRTGTYEAWLTAHGLEAVSLQAHELQQGDILPPLGVTVAETPLFTDSGLTHVSIQFTTGGKLVMRGNQELTIHRWIA